MRDDDRLELDLLELLEDDRDDVDEPLLDRVLLETEPEELEPDRLLGLLDVDGCEDPEDELPR